MLHATVAFFKSQFVAALSDGQRIEQPALLDMAYALHRAGVRASAVEYEWHAGQRMITAGQQAALRAEIHRLEGDEGGFSAAA